MKHGTRPFKKVIQTGYRFLGAVTPKSYTKSFELVIAVVHSSPDKAAQSDKAIPLEDAIDFAKQQIEQIMRKKVHKNAGVTVLIAEKGTIH